MEQCLRCQWRLFFKPLPDETFTACMAFSETVGQINLRTGVSPSIKEHGLESKPCNKFQAGRSLCEDHAYPARRVGEIWLFKKLVPEKVLCR